MAPIPQEMSGKTGAAVPGLHEDSVVISGMSGTYPNCLHMEDFYKMLYNKVDPLSESEIRWSYKHPEVPPITGTCPDMEGFDPQFFKINSQLAKCMDPMSRKLKEHVHRAIYDAGLSIDHLSGRKIGVYIGTSLAETVHALYYYDSNLSASTLPGCSKAMFANRISYWLNVRGPSMQVDDSCSSSLTALEQAHRAIKRGDCEAAIVGASNITIHPQTLIHYGRIIPLCKDGKTKAYDEGADGCVKSEAICVLFLQKVQDAIRIYAEVIHVKNEFNHTPSVGFYRTPKNLVDFMHGFYKEVNVSPNEIEYVEGFGCGAPEVDKAELEAIDEVFCKDRSEPLLVGSVTSNIGYTESSSGICGLTKVLLAYKTGVLAANLHCSQPRQDVMALRDGRMRIVSEHTPFSRTYAAVTGLSVTGINSHVLLRGFYKQKLPSPKTVIPLLIPISGRQEVAVQNMIDYVSQRPIDAEEVALLHNIHEEKNTGHLGRGYAILDMNEKGETVRLASSVEFFDDMKRPLWFVYSGMGSQWTGMGKELMRIPTFAAAIQKCDKVLSPRGLDIVNIISSPDKTLLDNILHCFVGIAAVQIGLTDVLREIGIVPDNIIGHSVGELGCGYADGCFTAEEVILAAWSRGTVSMKTKLIRGSMAAVGIGYQKAVKLCPPEIDIACHNGPESCTISGPAEAMREFVTKLTDMGIFAKEVPCSNIAYHSRYIADAGPQLLEYLKEVIKNPKRRSERWVSTSVPQERWSEENAQYCSAWYHTNNLLSPVLFDETSRLVPENAVLVEVAPHGLLQAILKRSLPADCRNIPLTKRGHPDNTLFFLQAIGKVFMQGYQPKIKNLYPKVQFPVSTETPGLSHLLEWNRNDACTLALYEKTTKEKTTIYNPLISIHDEESKHLRGNVIMGKNVYPLSAVLSCVWDTFAMTSGVARSELSVQFGDVHLFSQPPLLDKRHLQLTVTIQTGTGEFEVVTALSKVATGTVSQYAESLPQYEQTTQDKTTLDTENIYKLFQERDYSYSGDFCSIYKSNYSFTEAQLLWNDNWVTLIDAMLQLNAIRRDHDTVSQPSHIHNLIVDLKTHGDYKKTLDGKTVIPTVVSLVCDYTRCGGVLMEKVQFFDLPPPNAEIPFLKGVPENQANSRNINHLFSKNVLLQSERFGDLKSLSWAGTDSETSPSTSEDLVSVQYAGISVYDVNVATGVYSRKRGYLNKNVYGMEYSGTTDTGKRVMGLVRGGAASARVRGVPHLTWPVPAPWTLEDAATVPLAYAQAFYCLGIKAQLLPGMKILVHGGSGALGQAVISIALAHQCKVFTTVADDHKKQFLLKLFPQLTEDVIGCSRDTSFADMVLEATDGEGCDIAITCAVGNLKNMTLKCVTYCGITFDLTQAHLEDPFTYGMSFMTKQRSYVQVNFFSIFENEEYAKALQSMLSEGIARGYVRPLSRVTFAAQDSTRAFRLLAASRHRGRVLLRMPRDVTPAHTRYTCSPDHTQVVVCREDTLSYQFISRLIKCGAKKILLHYTRPSTLIQYKIESLQKRGIEIDTSTIELNNVATAQKMLSGRNVEGIYVFCPGSAQERLLVSSLDAVSRSLCPGLKYFAYICTTGPMDHTLCHSRRELQLPTTMLSLDKILNTSKVVSKPSIMDTIEHALCSSQKMLYVDLKPNSRKSLLKEIADKADIKLPANIREDATLQQLGLNNRYVKAISIILQCSFNISVPDEQIPKLSVKALSEFENCLVEPKFEETVGLPALFSYVAKDEHLGITNVVVLPTLVKSQIYYDGEVDLSQRYLCIVGGVEGQHGRFRTLCARLQLPAIVLQSTTTQLETFQDTARRNIEILKAKTNLKEYNDFYLLGYETGVLTALEMAAILEKEGMKGTVFCLGGCPEEVLQYIKNNLKDLDEDKLQTALIQQMVAIMSTEPVQNVDALVTKGSSLQDKLDDSLRELMRNVPRTTPYARALIEAAYARVQQALQHKVQAPTLKSRVVLLRPRSTLTDKSFNVELLSQEQVTTYDINVPLMYAAQHPQSASIINSNLSTDIVEAFKQQNNCETHEAACGFKHVQKYSFA